MKTARFFSLVIVFAVIFAAYTPSPAYASPENTITITSNSVEKAKITVVKLSITNKTGGTMYIRLTGPRSYYFVASNPGKNTFEILPGKYTVTHWTSACKGSITKTRNFNSRSASLGAWVCRK